MEIDNVVMMRLAGAMNGKMLVAEAQKFYDAGARNLLLDMTDLTFISSYGLSALHHIALMYRGEEKSTFREDRSAVKSMNKERGGGFKIQKHIKLFNPSETIRDILDIVGFTAFFAIYTDIDTAMASFQ
jgi:anti-anti-sigma regulatory factor